MNPLGVSIWRVMKRGWKKGVRNLYVKTARSNSMNAKNNLMKEG
jgi:hypothetical protein